MEETKRLCVDESKVYMIAFDITENQAELAEKINGITDKLDFVWLGSSIYSTTRFENEKDETISEIVDVGYEGLIKLVKNIYPLVKKVKGYYFGPCSAPYLDGPAIFDSVKDAFASFLLRLQDKVIEDGVRVTVLKLGFVGNNEGYGLDDKELQLDETGTSMLTLKDVTDSIEYCMDRASGYVKEITIDPIG